MDKQEPHMVRSRLAYSLGAFGHDAFFALLSTYFMMYVTGHLFTSSDKGFDNRMVGYVTAIIMILRIVELLIDPLIGNAIDRTNTKWGKFKPWVVGFIHAPWRTERLQSLPVPGCLCHYLHHYGYLLLIQ